MNARALVLVLVLLSGLAGAFAQEAVAVPDKKLRVGVSERPPFAMKDDAGQWGGIAVELWEKLAAKLNYSYEYVELPLDQVIPKLSRGELDVAVGELAVSAEREKLIDFTQPYVVTSGAVAMKHGAQRVKWEDFLQEMELHGAVTVILGMLVLLMVFSFVLWLAERAHNSGHFGGKAIHGFGSAIWFSAVTMTTVGYGDKTPQTPIGRFLAFLWMFSGILLVSAFTGTVASSITVTRLHATVRGVSDLQQQKNGVVEGSLAQSILGAMRVPAAPYATVKQGLAALDAKTITAFVGNDVSIQYEVDKDYAGEFDIILLPLEKVSFAIATSPGSPYLSPINVALIEETGSTGWQTNVSRWVPSTSSE